MLRSQDGVEEVVNPYGNLKDGLIEIRTSSDKAIDLAKLVELLEKEVGFEPVREVRLSLRGTVEKRNGTRRLVTAKTQQAFGLEEEGGKSSGPPENRVIAVSAVVTEPRKPESLKILDWQVVEGKPLDASPRQE